jgi:abortive infection bacteriophage resistance protein
LVYELQKLTLTTQHSYIAYQRNTYHNVPLWVLVNALTFGTLSKMYFFFPFDLQSKVSKNFAHVNEKQLGQFLTVMTKFRNVCAHNERLFSYRSKDAIPDMELHSKLGISKECSLYQCGKSDLFAVVIAFRYLLPKQEFLEFKRALTIQIDSFLKSTTHISEEELLRAMGFPANWKKISLYRI